jgi:hypothetical protein
LIVVWLLASWVLNADVYIKSVVHTDAFEMMGQKQPAKDEVSEQWLGDNKMVNISGDRCMIVNMGKKIMYIVNHKDKTYVEATLPLDMAKLLPKDQAQMLNMMKMTVKVTPNGQTKKVGQWNCAGYDVDMSMMMMQMKMVVWATTDVPFDWKIFSDLYSNISKLQFMDDNSIKEFMKIKGHQIASEMTMNMMGANMKINSQVTEISKKAAPADIYSVPAGYKKNDTLSMQELQGK